jgi:hypothetical protein
MLDYCPNAFYPNASSLSGILELRSLSQNLLEATRQSCHHGMVELKRVHTG